jgi:hypothetical protein
VGGAVDLDDQVLVGLVEVDLDRWSSLALRVPALPSLLSSIACSRTNGFFLPFARAIAASTPAANLATSTSAEGGA